jgi:hypothetical protein
VLARDYPLDHEITIYRSATLPIQQARIERIALGDLPGAEVSMEDTVVVPPAGPLQPNAEIRARLAQLDCGQVEVS